MSKTSLVQTAYEKLNSRYEAEGKNFKPVAFAELLQEVGAEIGLTDEEELINRASRFYTDLTLDGRFVIKENNTWALREHEKFEDIHIDMNEVYSLDEYKDEEEESPKTVDEDGEEVSDDDEVSSRSDDQEEELGEESDTDSDAVNLEKEYEENN